mmetsp:Transcript_1194/g.1578  ORF Transcript_1194/g.1578 Transcript_1194/m.1578 type:complete len:451 (+) Transcript_1194:28-1380(+)|eukprot:CAMPEP_0175141710 /NCGR_PEP_ID=MMETSP0087-20121206/12302_1 /TAXON_ID=136419 /ORGANISM="Unknown Unknown, Strain D1" /LENGTH=450 /DNA_ID=CAMNT_0016425247 /DNA_START=11 /DNA_END=1363 /DNA_ORIENTATION=+
MLVSLACFLGASLVTGAYCHGKPDQHAQPNLRPIIVTLPVHVKSVKNGHLFNVKDETEGVNFNIVHVYGSPYEMGYAQGELVGPQITKFLGEAFKYVEEQALENLNSTLPWLPPAVAKAIAEKGIDVVLDLEIEATQKFTPDYFNEELHGIADASGCDFKMLQRLHLFGELTKADCSMFGAWGDAVSPGTSLLQLRALDWITDGPFQTYPQVTVYHPPTGSGHAFANVGFNGFIGSFSGMSSVQTATSEIGVSFPDDTFGNDSRFGIPFTYLLRDLLQFDPTLQDGLDRITNANRTCSLILGFGDGKSTNGQLNGFRGIQYSHDVAKFMTDVNQMPVNDTWHPRLKDTVYYGMDWLCPAYNKVLHDQLQASYGKLTPELAISNITAIEQSGSLFVTYYDLTPEHNTMHISFAAPANTKGPMNAFDRAFTRLDMTAIFDLPPPSSTDPDPI